ncbi:MAG: hypothetical protein AB1805_16345 [Nitrospirota bacterium]
MFRKTMEKIKNISSMGDLHRSLDELASATHSILENNEVSLEEAGDLAKHLTEIRLMVTYLSHMRSAASPGMEACPPFENLKDRYLQLEGLAKEIRNDRYRAES